MPLICYTLTIFPFLLTVCLPAFPSRAPRRQDDRFVDTCLVDALRAHRYKVPYTGNGPFWAVADGSEMLKPLHKTIRPGSCSDLSAEGEYVLGYQRHFVALRRRYDTLEINLTNRSHQWCKCELSSTHKHALFGPCSHGIMWLNPQYIEGVFVVADVSTMSVPLSDYNGGSLPSDHTDDALPDAMTESDRTRCTVTYTLGGRWGVRGRFSAGEVPYDAVAEEAEAGERNMKVVPVCKKNEVASILLLVVPSFAAHTHCHPVYCLFRFGAEQLDHAVIVPFLPQPSWSGLWDYLDKAYGFVRPRGARYELQVHGMTVQETDDLAWLPHRSVVKLMSTTHAHPSVGPPVGTRPPWHSTAESMRRWHECGLCTMRLRNCAARNVCPSCKKLLRSLLPGDYHKIAATGGLGEMCSLHCAAVEHDIRPNPDRPEQITTVVFPLCAHPLRVQANIGTRFTAGDSFAHFELMPGSTTGRPLWQASFETHGFATHQGLPGDYNGASLHSELVRTIDLYVCVRRVELMTHTCSEFIHELVARPSLWTLFPSPMDLTSSGSDWMSAFYFARDRCREMAAAVPFDVLHIQSLPGRALSDFQRAVKRFFTLMRLLLLVTPHHAAVDYALWPSPFDITLTNRQWERWCLHVRQAARVASGEEDLIGGARMAIPAACPARFTSLLSELRHNWDAFCLHPVLLHLLPSIDKPMSSESQWNAELRVVSGIITALRDKDHASFVKLFMFKYGDFVEMHMYVLSLLPHRDDDPNMWERRCVSVILLVHVLTSYPEIHLQSNDGLHVRATTIHLSQHIDFTDSTSSQTVRLSTPAGPIDKDVCGGSQTEIEKQDVTTSLASASCYLSSYE